MGPSVEKLVSQQNQLFPTRLLTHSKTSQVCVPTLTLTSQRWRRDVNSSKIQQPTLLLTQVEGVVVAVVQQQQLLPQSQHQSKRRKKKKWNLISLVRCNRKI